MQETKKEETKAKSCLASWWDTDCKQNSNSSLEKMPPNLALLSETIHASNLGRSSILKSTKRHLKQIILEYEALDLEMPCIRKFQKPPAAQPLTLCMECTPEKDFCHKDILKAVEKIIPKALEKRRVCRIQFENMNVICGTAGRKNRWLITVSDFQTRNLFLRSGLVIGKDYFLLRRHDDVIMEDYKLHLRRALARKKILDMLSNSTDEDTLD
ncbi:putative uncharacterized protein C19orf81 homolog [Microcaecilia unicolor]|uniref:Uncharacterized protein n=1 Tax=Microcaecilia unicolor TaxID=1415580 RepID=A0A6P7XFP4_9AMPH|nr:putative uncharacterized protein C19orf81 homolog [Microcaecilia unicolor]